MKIAIVRNAGSAMANRVLQGVYGTLAAEEGAAKGSFRFAPEFNRVSHLFSAINSGEVDLEVTGVEVVDVPDNLANDFKAQLMHQLGARWQTMYGQVGESLQGDTITRALLSAESARATEGITTHMASMGNRLYKVAASVEAQTPYRSNEYGSKDDMMKGMRPVEGALFNLLDVDLANRPAGTATPVVETAQGEEQDAAVTQQQIHFEGHRAAGLVTYEVEIASSSREGAAALAQFILNDNSMREVTIAQNLTATPIKLENVRQGEAMSYGDTEYDEDHGDRHGY